MTDPAPILAAANLSYAVGGKTIVTGISFAMNQGEILAVIGPNGAGKSTMVRCLAGVVEPTSGGVTLSGRDRRHLSRRETARLLCHLPQAFGTVPPFPVRDFVAMGRYAHANFWSGLTAGDWRVADQALDLAGIGDLADRPLPQLSGGERQLVAIAAGLAQEAPLLVLDEPATFLDPYHQDRLLQLLLRLNREQGISILLVTHDVNMALLFSHRTLALRGGRVVFHGASTDLADQGTLTDIFGLPFSFVPIGASGKSLAVSGAFAAW